MSTSSLHSYKSAQNHFCKFCSAFNLCPFPLSETILCSFATYLAKEGLKYQSIKCYISALRHAQIANSFPDSQLASTCPRLEYIMRGIRRTQAEAGIQPRTRLPITPQVLSAIYSYLPRSPDSVMIWAACCIGFFGFLRSGEFTVPSLEEYDPSVHLSLLDIDLDSHTHPSILRIRLKQSKMDPFRLGVDIYMGKTRHPFLCHLVALIHYLRLRGPHPGPLFQFTGGTPLSRPRLIADVRSCLARVGIHEDLYCGHSFRIGAATTAAKVGLDDSLIQTLGRWQSATYLRYIKLSWASLTSVSQALVGQLAV